MRKQEAFFIAIAFLYMSLTAASAIQFYQPNRAARLVVSVKAKAKYDTRPVIVTVMLSNQAVKPLLINSRMLITRYPMPGELAFQVEGPGNKEHPLLKPVIAPELRDSDVIVLPAGQTIEREVDLTSLYAVRKQGNYRIQAIYYNSVELEKDGLETWRGTIASEITQILLD